LSYSGESDEIPAQCLSVVKKLGTPVGGDYFVSGGADWRAFADFVLKVGKIEEGVPIGAGTQRRPRPAMGSFGGRAVFDGDEMPGHLPQRNSRFIIRRVQLGRKLN